MEMTLATIPFSIRIPNLNFQSINDGLWEEEEAIGCGHNVLYIYINVRTHTQGKSESAGLNFRTRSLTGHHHHQPHFPLLFNSSFLLEITHTHTQNVISWRTMLGWAGEKSQLCTEIIFFPSFSIQFFFFFTFFLNADQHYQKWPFHQTQYVVTIRPIQLAFFFSRQQGTKKKRRGNVRWKKE